MEKIKSLIGNWKLVPTIKSLTQFSHSVYLFRLYAFGIHTYKILIKKQACT